MGTPCAGVSFFCSGVRFADSVLHFSDGNGVQFEFWGEDPIEENQFVVCSTFNLFGSYRRDLGVDPTNNELDHGTQLAWDKMNQTTVTNVA